MLAGFSLPTAPGPCSTPRSFDTSAPGRRAPTRQVATGDRRRPAPGGAGGQRPAVVNELSNAVDGELSFISTALLIFVFIVLFVGVFTIFRHALDHGSASGRGAGAAARRRASRRQMSSRCWANGPSWHDRLPMGLGMGVPRRSAQGLLPGSNVVPPCAARVRPQPVVAIAVGVGVAAISAVLRPAGPCGSRRSPRSSTTARTGSCRCDGAGSEPAAASRSPASAPCSRG